MNDGFGEIDPDEIDAPNRRRWLTPVVVGGALLATGVGVVVWSPWSSAGSATNTTIAAPELSEELIIGEPPPGYEPDEVRLRGARLESVEDDFDLSAIAGLVFAAPGGTMDDGPMLAFYGSDDESFVDSLGMADGDESTSVSINGVEGHYVDEQSEQLLVWGPDRDGFSYLAVGIAVGQNELVAFAEGVRVSGTIPEVDADVIEGFELVSDFDTLVSVSGLASPEFGIGGDVVAVGYSSEGATLTVSSTAVPSVDEGLNVLRVSGDVTAVEINGHPGFLSLDGSGDIGGNWIGWGEGGRIVMVSAEDRLTVDEWIALAESVRVATPDEWREIRQLPTMTF